MYIVWYIIVYMYLYTWQTRLGKGRERCARLGERGERRARERRESNCICMFVIYLYMYMYLHMYKRGETHVIIAKKKLRVIINSDYRYVS